MLKFKRHFFSARDIFTTTASLAPGGMPSFCNLKISGSPQEIVGCGLYFFVHREHLVYVGKFLGSIRNAFGGDIFSARWNRHISTLSLRGSRISIGQAALRKAVAEGLPGDLEAALCSATPTTLAQDRGFSVPYKRLRYAALHWEDFSLAPECWLADIKVGYLQLDPSLSSQYSITELRDIVSDAERRTIQRIPTVLNGPGEFDIDLLRAMSKEDIFGELMSMFIDPSNAISENGYQRPAVGLNIESEDDGQEATLSSEIESEFYGEQFLELLPSGCPEETVRAIYEEFEGVPEAQMHHTKTNGGDLRVRALCNQRERNLFTMYWQPRNQVFLCRIFLNPEQVTGAGIVEASPSGGTEPLPTTFKFDCMVPGAIANLIKLIKQALTAYCN